MKTSISLRKFLEEEAGASSIEYAILASMIAAVCVIIISILGIKTKDLFDIILQLWK